MDEDRLEELLQAFEARVRAGDGRATRALIEASVGLGDTSIPRRSAKRARPATPDDLASYVDHTLLRPEATGADIDRLCDEALRYRFASVCVHGVWLQRCARRLEGSQVLACAVIGFPSGASSPGAKALEAHLALEAGADELDMVQQVGALRSGDHGLVQRDIEGVVAAAQPYGARVKVILETCLLTDAEKRQACALAEAAGAHFVKTSTGFGSAGATVQDVALMRSAVGERLGVKASGGIRDREAARRMIEAGATRLGASAGVAMVGG